MGEAFISRRGGGGSRRALDGYALICVRYPAGSDCVCEMGGESCRVRNGSGLAAFAVSGPGAWTVSCSDGTHSTSGSVVIASAGELKSVQISYASEPELGDGVLVSAQGGLGSGYSVGGNADVSGNAIVESGSGGFYISPAIDLRGYSTLTVTGVLLSLNGQSSIITVASTPGKAMSYLQSPELAVNWNGLVNQDSTLTIDLSGLNGCYYIGSASVGNNLRITGIALS